jgi:hypothetical protein
MASTKCLEGNGVGDLTDAGVWGVVWATAAAIAGAGLAVAALAFARRFRVLDCLEFDGAYNALAPFLDR